MQHVKYCVQTGLKEFSFLSRYSPYLSYILHGIYLSYTFDNAYDKYGSIYLMYNYVNDINQIYIFNI